MKQKVQNDDMGYIIEAIFCLIMTYVTKGTGLSTLFGVLFIAGVVTVIIRQIKGLS